MNDNNPRKIDPTTNPITRRPGPGRGRPRKSAANAAGTGAATSASASGSPGDASAQGTETIDPAQGQQPQPLTQQLQQPLPPLPPQPNMDPSVGPAPTPMMESAPPQMHAPPTQSPIEIQTEGVFPEDASEEPDEHASKRAKLEENHDPALNDEAMLSALAAHNNPDSMGHYNPE